MFPAAVELTDNAGYRLDAGRFHIGAPLRDAFVAARFYNQATGRSNRFADVLNQAVTRRDDRPPRRPGESSIERLQQRVDDQRTRRREQSRPGGSTAHDGPRGPRQGPSR
ncbi:hypothetical protein [Curtobacterium sp. MCBA15_007]|uniref:hypothetical protein n=1 Tax=Curtobacterium sp. MCBA15_007 TaxID=1898735 RepID=UPI0008DCFC34|nr:hypothetical protein [Curtobacterium sp. MCBA15_007]